MKAKILFFSLVFGTQFLAASNISFAGPLSFTGKSARNATAAATAAAALRSNAESISSTAERARARQNAIANDFNIYNFSYYSISEGFKRGIEVQLAGRIIDEYGKEQKFEIEISTKPGQWQNRYGNVWIDVIGEYKEEFDSEIIRSEFIDVYREDTKELARTIYKDDGSVTEYTPLKIPSGRKFNEFYKADEIVEKDKDGQITSRGHVGIRVQKNGKDIEGCWIYTLTSEPENITTLITSCDIFDENMQLRSGRLEVREAGELLYSASGPAQLK